jgi:type VI secretion system protein ImpL
VKRLLLAPLRYPRATMAVGVALFACLVWFAGPLVGLEEPGARLLVIVATLVFWVLFLLFDRFRTERGGKLLEASLQQQACDQLAGTRPDRKEEIEALKVQFDQAVASLKGSKLGKGRSGSAVLSALPWYMFIGPPGSGKSTALQHSGLQFPSVGQAGKGVRGVGGTRNCDWWFTNEAVLLDTAGRYVTEDEDRGEWLSFLDLLKRGRKRRAINGVLVTISIPDLLQTNDEELEAHAKKIRARVDELIGRLGIVFPVYLLFTKCDLLRGFVEFFEDLNRAEREQIWGCTLPRAMSAGMSPPRVFEVEFRRLGEALDARRMARLASARGSQKIRDIYGFPLQLTSGRERLARFVEVLFQPNPYQENPIFRGFYLTSGTQEGTPIDRILSAVSRASGLSEVISESFETEKESKSYFIKNLFTDVIFPDQVLAGSSSAMERQRGYLRVGIFAGAVAALVIAVVWLSFSFLANRQFVASVKAASLRVVRMNPEDERQFVPNVGLLDGLRARLEQLRDYAQDGPPLRLRGGLYRGSALYQPVRSLYARHFNEMFLLPTRSVMEIELAGFVANPRNLAADRDTDYYYSLLKAYLMLSDPARLDPVFLNPWLQRLWRDLLVAQYGAGTVREGLDEAVTRQMVFYGDQLLRDTVPPMAADTRLVKDTQRVLQAVPMIDRAYARVRRQASEGLKPYTLETALRGRPQDALTASARVPGLFTESGGGAFRETMATVLEASGEEGWVLGVPEPARPDMEAALEAKYFEEYVKQWQLFLEGVQIRPADSLADTVKQLEVLTADDSPLVTLLNDVVVQTDLGSKPGQAMGVASSLVQKVKRGLRLDRAEASASEPAPTHPVAVRFRFLRDFVTPSADGKRPAPLSLYLEELRKVHEAIRPMAQSGAAATDTRATAETTTGGTNDLALALRNTERLVQSFDPEAKRIVGGLLLKPVSAAVGGVMAIAQSDLNKRWRADVYEPCARSIAGRYPFNRGGEDVALADVAEFFHPQEGLLWKFYDQELKSFVEEGPDRWALRKRGEGGLVLSSEFLENLRRARLISDSVFPRGQADPRISFDVYPYPISGATEILLHVDGKDLRYRNEPQEWHELMWPGPSGTSGAAVQVQLGGRAVKHFPGRWGWFRLLDAGRLTPAGASRYRVEWDILIQGKPVKVRYDLRAQSYKNPFKPGFFSDFRCVAKLG